MTIKTIYLVAIADDDVGEVEGFFDRQGNLLHCWCLNDANWRGEYMDPLIEAIGYKVSYIKYDDPVLVEKLRKVYK